MTNTSIYYTSIGERLDREWLTQLCQENGLDCQNLGHHDTGHELLTLDKVKDFCSHYPDQMVSYIHTKGSFHVDIHQDRWRRHMTAASTSQECLEHLSSASPSDTCNTCGLLFTPLPLEHFAGNSWVAKCSYIQQLLPPSELQIKRASLMENLREQGLKPDFFPAVPAHIGTDRYLGEQWIGSSPKLVPCDVSRHAGIDYWMGDERNTTEEFEWQLAPRFSMNHTEWAWQAAIEHAEVLDKPYRRMRDFFLLPGHLHRWVHEYNAVPDASTSSWVWSWFIDGYRWQKRVNQDGIFAVQNFVAQSRK